MHLADSALTIERSGSQILAPCLTDSLCTMSSAHVLSAVNGTAYRGRDKKELPASPFDVPVPVATSVPAALQNLYPSSSAPTSTAASMGKLDSFTFQPGISRLGKLPSCHSCEQHGKSLGHTIKGPAVTKPSSASAKRRKLLSRLFDMSSRSYGKTSRSQGILCHRFSWTYRCRTRSCNNWPAKSLANTDNPGAGADHGAAARPHHGSQRRGAACPAATPLPQLHGQRGTSVHTLLPHSHLSILAGVDRFVGF